MSNAPAFQLYAGDFFLDTMEWELEELGLYSRLLFYEWINGPLPIEPRKLAKISLIGPRKLAQLWPKIERKFIEKDGFYINIRLEETREKQRQFIESQREKGKKRAEDRWHKGIATATNGLQPKDSPSSSSSSSTPSPIKKDKTLKRFMSDSIEVGLSDYLFNLVKSNNPHAKEPNIQTWAKDIDLMIRIDNRNPEEIKKIITWCQKDQFWHKNILSTDKLRKQYDKLYLEMGGSNGNGTRQDNLDPIERLKKEMNLDNRTDT